MMRLIRNRVRSVPPMPHIIIVTPKVQLSIKNDLREMLIEYVEIPQGEKVKQHGFRILKIQPSYCVR